MVGWKGHLLFALVITSIVFFILYYYNLLVNIEWTKFYLLLPLILIYALLPDIDISSSFIRQIYIFTLILGI